MMKKVEVSNMVSSETYWVNIGCGDLMLTNGYSGPAKFLCFGKDDLSARRLYEFEFPFPISTAYNCLYYGDVEIRHVNVNMDIVRKTAHPRKYWVSDEVLEVYYMDEI